MVCLMNQANICFPAQDTRGPYKTHDECYERTVEMSAAILENVPNHIPVSWRCLKLGTQT